MAKIQQSRFRQTVKTIKIDERLVVHKLARVPYRIFCESIRHNVLISRNKLEPKTPLIEIIEHKKNYHFYDDFETISSLLDGDKLSIRRIDISNAEIERRAWGCLLNHLEVSKPLNIELLHKFKNNIPKHVQKYFFDRILTIQHILDLRGIPRHKYDYSLQKLGSLKTHQLPSFSDLIQEVRNDSK